MQKESSKHEKRDHASSLPEREMRHGPKSAVAQHMAGLQRLRVQFDPALAAYQDAIGEPIPGEHSTDYEHTVATAFQEEIKDLWNSLGQRIKQIDSDLNRELPSESSINDAVITAQITVEKRLLLESRRPRLVEAKRMVARTQVEIQRFKRDNPSVAARIADHPSMITGGIWMAAILLLETYLNSSFLLTTGAFSFTEATALCFGTAVLNLFFGSVFIGFRGIRYLNHARSEERWKGRAFVLVGVVILFGLHLVLAHFRMAVDTLAATGEAGLTEALIQQIPSVVMHTLTTKPASFLGDLHSIIVFLMGVAFAVFATAEGYWLIKDRYPGYQETDTEHLKAVALFASLQNDFRKGLIAITEAADTQIEKTLNQGVERQRWIRSHLNDAAHAVAAYEQEATQCQQELVHMISEYRTEYCRLRQTPGPPHWRHQIPILNRDVPTFLNDLERVETRENNALLTLKSRVVQLQGILKKRLAEDLEGMEKFLNEVVQDTGPIVLDNHYNQVGGVRRPPPPSVN